MLACPSLTLALQHLRGACWTFYWTEAYKAIRALQASLKDNFMVASIAGWSIVLLLLDWYQDIALSLFQIWSEHFWPSCNLHFRLRSVWSPAAASVQLPIAVAIARPLWAAPCNDSTAQWAPSGPAIVFPSLLGQCFRICPVSAACPGFAALQTVLASPKYSVARSSLESGCHWTGLRQGRLEGKCFFCVGTDCIAKSWQL